MHLLNLILADALSDSDSGDVADPCAWYFINISIDTFIGCFLQFFLLELVENFAAKRKGGRCGASPPGFYGDLPKMSWWAGCRVLPPRWAEQVLIFIFVYLARGPLGVRLGCSALARITHGRARHRHDTSPGIMNAWMFGHDTFIMRMVKPGATAIRRGAAACAGGSKRNYVMGSRVATKWGCLTTPPEPLMRRACRAASAVVLAAAQCRTRSTALTC